MLLCLVFAIIDRSSWQKIFPATKSVVSLVISCWVWTSCVTFSYITCQQTCTDFVSSLSLDHVSCLSLSFASLSPAWQFLAAVYFGLNHLCCTEPAESFFPSVVILSASVFRHFISTPLPLLIFSLSVFLFLQVECNLQQIWWSPKIREHDPVLWLRWVFLLCVIFLFFLFAVLASVLFLTSTVAFVHAVSSSP